jgi:Mg-chelatase subunit ChlD
VTRRELSGSPLFDEISPELGKIDEAAVSEALDRDPDELMSLLAQMSQATDVRLRALAKDLAARLFLDLARTQAPQVPGVGRVVTVPYRPDGGDLDVERSLEGIVAANAAQRLVEPDELAIRSWARPSTAWCLVIDRSGSMHGRPLAAAAMAAAAVAVRAGSDYAVLSFGREVVAPKAMWEVRSADDLLDRVLALRGHGTTDVARALWSAGRQLRSSGAGRRITILLSDCRSTEPGDAVAAARALDELVILAPEGDSVEAAQLAQQVAARWTTVDGPSSIVTALGAVLDR